MAISGEHYLFMCVYIYNSDLRRAFAHNRQTLLDPPKAKPKRPTLVGRRRRRRWSCKI